MQQIQIISLSFLFKCRMPMVEFYSKIYTSSYCTKENYKNVEMKLPTIKSLKNLYKSTLPTFKLLSIIMV